MSWANIFPTDIKKWKRSNRLKKSKQTHIKVTQQTLCELSYTQKPDAGNPVSQKILLSGRGNQMPLFWQTRAWPEEISTVGKIWLFLSPLCCFEKKGKWLKGDSVLHEKEKWFIKCWAMPHCLLHHFKPWRMSSPTTSTLFPSWYIFTNT